MSNFPPFIMTTTNRSVIVVEDNQIDLVKRNGAIHYGVTWSESEIFLGVRKEQIEILDRNFKVVKTWNGFNDMHQILFQDDTLYVTLTSKNSIAVVDKDTGKFTEKNWTKFKNDANHINSIFFDGTDFWFCYHNRDVDSQCVKVDSNLDNLIETHDIGHLAHNVYFDGKFLFTCDSINGSLVKKNMKTGEISESVVDRFARGLAVTDDFILVGSNGIEAQRRARNSGDVHVTLLDRKTFKQLDVKIFPNEGSIYDLRVIGQHDYAHNNIKFPGNLEL